MQVRIYQPAKNAMQSGRGATHKWVLEFEPAGRKEADDLMGWIGSADTNGQVRLTFGSRDEALAFAKRNGYEPTIVAPEARRFQIKSYADNFAFKRVV